MENNIHTGEKKKEAQKQNNNNVNEKNFTKSSMKTKLQSFTTTIDERVSS